MKIWQLFTPEKPGSASTRPPPICRLVADQALAHLEQRGLDRVAADMRLLCSLLTESPDTPAVLGAWFEDDPSSAARLVRMANNGYYVANTCRPVTSLGEALDRISVASALEVAMAALAKRLFDLSFEADPEFGRNLWIHALGTATAARRCHELVYGDAANRTTAYWAGLIHDLGIAIEHTILAENGFTAAVENQRRRGTPLVTEELAVLHFSHEDLGLELARRWDLPLETRAALGFHHRPLPNAGEADALVKTVRLADWLGCEYSIGGSDLSRARQAEEYARLRQQLGLTETAEAEVVRAVTYELRQMEKASWLTQYRTRLPLCA